MAMEARLQVPAEVVKGLVVDLTDIFKPLRDFLLLGFEMHVDEGKRRVIEIEAN